jgi:hypothetical protein
MQPQETHTRRPFLVLAASYSCFTPFIVAILTTVFFIIVDQAEAKQHRIIFARHAAGDVLLIPFWLLVSSLLFGVLSLFGIRKHGASPILLKAIIGILASFGFGFIVFALIGNS